MAKIGVEQSLTNVSEALQNNGYEVVTLKQESDAKNCDVCVITGQDENMMGIQNTITEGSIINASGLSAEEVCQEVETRLR
ncbi:hypothetical protein DCC39_00220 [Pueribacillus theae]|uniref:UPF0180 protein DCC39_00220 n=1 Tax=Pueribacillus theae TaxID=2171751 RepID=A0A2U1K748_9BACI|nr:YkuS family protein [Pueribacillus theae]PWA13356.1 hypothetical protein DCC39_00220 [Pueribacillus theae]